MIFLCIARTASDVDRLTAGGVRLTAIFGGYLGSKQHRVGPLIRKKGSPPRGDGYGWYGWTGVDSRWVANGMAVEVAYRYAAPLRATSVNPGEALVADKLIYDTSGGCENNACNYDEFHRRLRGPHLYGNFKSGLWWDNNVKADDPSEWTEGLGSMHSASWRRWGVYPPDGMPNHNSVCADGGVRSVGEKYWPYVSRFTNYYYLGSIPRNLTGVGVNQ
ncbi:MAG: hypothetical protein ACLFWL_08740 [Candidatus Brocadiia bacterium]